MPAHRTYRTDSEAIDARPITLTITTPTRVTTHVLAGAGTAADVTALEEMTYEAIRAGASVMQFLVTGPPGEANLIVNARHVESMMFTREAGQ